MEANIARAAEQIDLRAGLTNAMPPANLTHMEDAERRTIIGWYQSANALSLQ